MWLAPDKAQHFAACGLVSLVCFAAASRRGASRRAAFVVSLCSGLVVGVAKELLDLAGLWPTGGAFSWRDLVADAAGSVVVTLALVLRDAGVAQRRAAKRATPGSELDASDAV